MSTLNLLKNGTVSATERGTVENHMRLDPRGTQKTVEGAMGNTDKLTKKEVRAFHDACAVRGRDGKDFTLELLTVDSGSSQIQSRIVAVRRDGIQRCYDASFGADWIGQLIDDMRAGRWL